MAEASWRSLNPDARNVKLSLSFDEVRIETLSPLALISLRVEPNMRYKLV